MFADRAALVAKATTWLEANQGVTITDLVVTQSSDAQFHCIAITVFYRQ